MVRARRVAMAAVVWLHVNVTDINSPASLTYNLDIYAYIGAKLFVVRMALCLLFQTVCPLNFVP